MTFDEVIVYVSPALALVMGKCDTGEALCNIVPDKVVFRDGQKLRPLFAALAEVLCFGCLIVDSIKTQQMADLARR